MENIRFNVGRGQRLLLFVCVATLCLLVTAVLVYIIGTDTTPKARIGAVLQDVIAFAVPAVAVAVMVTRRPADLLMIHKPEPVAAMAMVMALLVAMPALNLLVEWNASLPQPESFRADAEAQHAMIEMLFGGTGIGSLVAALLIIGVMAPLTEEMLFRGCLQRLLQSIAGRSGAVWIAAAVFSFMHFDLTGVVPRMVLGVIFGYAMLWSGSLWTAVACHSINNCLAVTAMWLEMRGSAAGTELQTFGSTSLGLVALSVVVASGLAFVAYRHRRLIADRQ